MKIKCFGSRGSIPVSGQDYNRYGGNTTCVEVISESGKRLIIDAGSGIRELGLEYEEKKIRDITILITHYHFDHIMGLPFFKPLFSHNTKINIIGPSYNGMECIDIIKSIINPPAFPVDFRTFLDQSRFSFRTIEPGIELDFNGFHVNTISLSHPNGGIGYKFSDNGKKFVFLTDNELDHDHHFSRSFDDYALFSEDADLLIHDSEFFEDEYRNTRSWGHSTFISALDLAHKARVRHFGLFHHNQFRKDRDVTRMLELSIKYMKKNNMDFNISAISQNFEIEI